jgi:acyl-ACP thioesterase
MNSDYPQPLTYMALDFVMLRGKLRVESEARWLNFLDDTLRPARNEKTFLREGSVINFLQEKEVEATKQKEEKRKRPEPDEEQEGMPQRQHCPPEDLKAV